MRLRRGAALQLGKDTFLLVSVFTLFGFLLRYHSKRHTNIHGISTPARTRRAVEMSFQNDLNKTVDNFSSRRARLQRVCDKYRGNYYQPEYNALFGSDTRATAYLQHYFDWKEKLYVINNPPKTGSTSWKHFLWNEDLEMTEDCKVCKRENVAKVMLQVRHPLERLVSTYRHLIKEQAWRIGEWKYLMKNDSSSMKHFLLHNNISWTDFISKVVLNGSLISMLSLEDLHSGQHLERPFETTLMTHWAPYWFILGACKKDIFPDYILKVETLEEDFNHLKKILDFPSDFKITKVQPHGLNKPDFTKTSLLAKKHYGELTKTQVRELYEMYKLDHEMFGYSPHKYIQFAKGL